MAQTSTGWRAGETVSIYEAAPTPGAALAASAVTSAVADVNGAIAVTLSPATDYIALGGTSARRARLRGKPYVPKQFVAAQFAGDDQPNGEKLFLSVNAGDARTFSPVGGPVLAAGIRDPDIIQWGGRYWLAYTKAPCFGVVSSAFGLKVSDDLVTWTDLPDVSCAGAGTVNRCWGPTWIVDGGRLRLYIALSAVSSDLGPFVMWETHPTNGAMTAWSTPVNVSSGLTAPAAGIFDMIAVQRAGQWVALYKNNTAETIERAVSNSPLGPWTVTHTGDWAGWIAGIGAGAKIEGSHLELLPNGNWRHWFDCYTLPGLAGGDFRRATEYYSDSADLITWSTPQVAATLGRHSRPRAMDVPDGLTFARPTPHVHLERSAVFTLVTGVYTPITWDTVWEDASGMYNTTIAALGAGDGTSEANTPAGTKFVTVREGGLWDITASAVFLAAAGTRFLGVQFNDSYAPGWTSKAPSATDNALIVSGERRLRRGDRVSVIAQQDSGGNLNLGTVPVPRLTMTRTGN